MPTVPTYEPRVSATADPGTQFALPSVSGAMIGARQTEDLGRSTMQAGSSVSGIGLDMLQQANQVRVNDAMNQAMAARLKWTHDKDVGYTNLQGDQALTRPDNKSLDQEYGDKLKGDLDKIASGLGNDAQRRAFSMQSGQLLTQFQGQVQQHMAQEFKQYRASTQLGTVKVAVDQMAMDWQNPDSLAQGQAAIKAASAEMGKLKGMSPAETTAMTVDALSQGHSAVIASALQAGKLDYAKAYMDKVDAELTPAARLQLQEKLKVSTVALQASQTADDIWTKAGPGDDRNAPVDLFAMEKAARAAFPQEPEKAKATIGELRERAAAFNASQQEFHAANTTDVFKMIDSGMSMNKVRLSPQWQALPGDQQHRVMLQIEQEGAARAQRAAANESRELTKLQHEDALTLLQHGDAYMRYGDPEVLAGMTRTQVEALRPTFGLEGTQHLLQRWDAMQTRDGKLTATIDKQDFDHIADQMGLSPFKADTEDKKRQLGELQFRVEQLIDHAQQTKKAPLTRDEKAELMRQELARQVAVPTWMGLSSQKVPVIQLTPEQAAKVSVPAQDRAQIVEALRTMYARQPMPQYEPSEDNIRRWYLTHQSPAAKLIPNAK